METTAWKRAQRHIEIDLVPDNMTPNEEHLLGVIAKLAERIEQLENQQRRAKGETTRPDIKPSRLNQPDAGAGQDGGKRQRSVQEEVHETSRLGQTEQDAAPGDP